MPTFAELQSQLTDLKNRKSILVHLIEYIDESFLPVAGSDPKKQLLDDGRVAVPVTAFENFVSDTLSAEVEEIDKELNRIMGSELGEKPQDRRPKRGPATPAKEGAAK